jgi:hypothetical protein
VRVSDASVARVALREVLACEATLLLYQRRREARRPASADARPADGAARAGGPEAQLAEVGAPLPDARGGEGCSGEGCRSGGGSPGGGDAEAGASGDHSCSGSGQAGGDSPPLAPHERPEVGALL